MVPHALFELFGQGIHLYGVLIALGIIACLIVFFVYTKKDGMNSAVQDFVFYVAIIAIILGFLAAKLFQAFYDWIETGVFDFYGAGITAMGGFIGGAVAFIGAYFGWGHFYFKKKNKNLHVKQFNKVVRVAPLCIVIAHALGRVGCLMAGCCHGALLSSSEYVVGGIWMRAADTGLWGYYVPTQLYEALFLFVLFAVLSLLYFKKSNLILQIYMIAYGVWRIIIELFRTDMRGAIVLGLAPSQWQSILFIAGGIALILIYYFLKWPFVIREREERDESKTSGVLETEGVADIEQKTESGDEVETETKEEEDKE